MAIILTFLGFLCMWLMWFSVFMHQKNPIITNELEEDVLRNIVNKHNL